MSKAKVTLYGLARWCNDNESDLFSDMLLPDGIDKDILCNNILFRGSEYEVMYPDPDFMKVQVGYWSRRNYRMFDKWIKALNIPYEPLYNLDVYEEWKDEGSRKDTASSNLIGGYERTDGFERAETLEEDITDTNDLHSETDAGNTTENTRSAFDANTYQPHDKQEVMATSSTDDTGDVKRDRDQTIKTTNDGTQKDQHTESKTDISSGENTNEHSGHRYGNQGITMSQQMLQAELDISKWNIYEHITDLFLRDFVIPIFE